MDSKEPILILAPMYNVTDVVFRQIIADCAPPDVFVTEFVNVDGLQSAGRDKLLPYLYLEDTGVSVWAQIWGRNPANYYKTARELSEKGFTGIDINMGCPDRAVVKNNACSALIKPANRKLVADIIAATREGAGTLPVSVKTRLGFDSTDLSWHAFLLEQDLDFLSVHARTTAEKSKVPARWHEVGQIKALSLKISPKTKIIGNGDIATRHQALQLCRTYFWDGAMLGRAIFNDPFLFATQSPWLKMNPLAKAKLYLKHLKLFEQTYESRERSFEPLKKFMKVYLTGFEHAQKLRLQIAATKRTSEAVKILENYLQAG